MRTKRLNLQLIKSITHLLKTQFFSKLQVILSGDQFLKNNLRYPNLAVQKGTQGTVFAQFVVEKDGTISNIKILQDIGDGCGYEARRVIELMNTMTQRWTPGIQSNHPVRVQYTLPIVFQGRQ